MTIKFADLGLGAETLEAITKKGFEEPTEVQARAIPLLLSSDKDVIVQAQTGTGKTATFGLVFTDRLVAKKSRKPQAIVLAPTRELAVQISEELNSLKGNKPFKIIPIYGGQSWTLQQRHLRDGVDIVVGTPGRIMDHLKKGTLDLSEAEYLVLDEADEMLNMGFIEDIEIIMSYINDNRKTLLFSATMPMRIKQLAERYMKTPESIKAQKQQITNNAIAQIYFEVHRNDRFEALCRIIDMEEDFYGIVFCRTKLDADEVSKHLSDRGYKADAMHGDVSQDRREQILKSFKAKKTEVLVATDVAARGIDVQDLTHVINYSLPQDPESYVHRIGRTGRAGKSGTAITLITPIESRKLRVFERQAKAKMERQSIPSGQAMVELKKKKIIQTLNTMLENTSDIDQYKALAKEMFSEANSEDLVAALLSLNHSAALDKRSYREIKDVQSRNTPNAFGPTRLFLTTGKKDGATRDSISKMVNDDFGVAPTAIQGLDIMESFSFLTVPFDDAETILEAFNQMKKRGRPPVRVEKASHGKRGGGGGGGYKGGGSRGGYRGGGGYKGGNKNRGGGFKGRGNDSGGGGYRGKRD